MKNIVRRCTRCNKKIGFGSSHCVECETKFRKQYKKNLKDKDAEKVLNTRQWKRTREEVLIRDKGCCVMCLSENRIEQRRLEVHHIYKRTDRLDLAYDKRFLVTVCKKHHEFLEKLSPDKQMEVLGLSKPTYIDFEL